MKKMLETIIKTDINMYVSVCVCIEAVMYGTEMKEIKRYRSKPCSILQV